MPRHMVTSMHATRKALSRLSCTASSWGSGRVVLLVVRRWALRIDSALTQRSRRVASIWVTSGEAGGRISGNQFICTGDGLVMSQLGVA